MSHVMSLHLFIIQLFLHIFQLHLGVLLDIQGSLETEMALANPKVYLATNHPFPPHCLTMTQSSLPLEPISYSDAQKHAQWCSAMADEFNSLLKQGTWTLVSPPSHGNIVGCKWVYKLKQRADGSLERYKARLVAKGYHQQPGLDYTETFSPVVKAQTIRIVISIAVTNNWPLLQLDAKSAFLHGALDEEVYMSQPPGFVDPMFLTHVCKLHKAIYGLKQAPRAWFQSLSSHLSSMGFRCSTTDSSMFVVQKGDVIIVGLV